MGSLSPLALGITSTPLRIPPGSGSGIGIPLGSLGDPPRTPQTPPDPRSGTSTSQPRHPGSHPSPWGIPQGLGWIPGILGGIPLGSGWIPP